MGSANSTPAPIVKGIKAALDNDDELYAFPGDLLYDIKDVKPYNLDRVVRPAAITYPKTTVQVSAIIKVAVENQRKVQARGGGHSYGNYSIGGVDGAIIIDLKHMKHFSMDTTNWHATVGAGMLLGELTTKMFTHGQRAMAHGTCPQVGLSGHATIGGLGPTSRLWGTSIDHILEVEIVLADSRIVRASSTQNTDIFWAIRGAGASFGVITQFIVKTEPAPGECVQFSFSFTGGTYGKLAATFKRWQKFVSNPNLTRKFTTEIVITSLGLIISGTYFGSKAEYDALQLSARFPGTKDVKALVFKDWVGLVAHWGQQVALQIGGGIAAPIYSKSLTFNQCFLIPDQAVNNLFRYLGRVDKGTFAWFIVFDLEGGAVNDVPQDATAYAHRDALFYMQSYAIGLPRIRRTTKRFLRGVNDLIKKEMPGGQDFGSYPGYVDPELKNGQKEYWRGNLPRLEQIKKDVDPGQVFWNPQSVRPTGSPPDPPFVRGKYRSVLKFWFCQS